MTWTLVITLQIIASSCMTIVSRRFSLQDRKAFFVLGAFMYLTIASAGFLYSFIAANGLPDIPNIEAWPLLIGAGTAIPLSWLAQYKLIGLIGAGNAVIATSLNTAAAAFAGILFLNESLSIFFALGALSLFLSIFVAFRIKPDTEHIQTENLRKVILIVMTGALFFAIGMLFEKKALTTIGVWNYAAYGWGMQAVGAVVIAAIFGRKEHEHITRNTVLRSVILGTITSIAGGLYIYALNLGSLSNTALASSGKVALTMLLAALFLHERNNIGRRVLAFALATLGILLIFY